LTVFVPGRFYYHIPNFDEFSEYIYAFVTVNFSRYANNETLNALNSWYMQLSLKIYIIEEQTIKGQLVYVTERGYIDNNTKLLT